MTMIMYLEYSAEGRRGGEIFHSRLHSFLVENFPNVTPERLFSLPPELTGPLKHARFNLKLVKKHRPDMVVADVSSSFRNILAVRWMKSNKRAVLLVVRGRRVTYRHDSIVVRWLVRFCEDYLLKHADIVLVNSQYTADLARRRSKEDRPIVIAPPGVQVQPIPSEGTSADGVEVHGPIKLLFVGECVPVKGLKHLIEALSMLKDVNIHLDVAGAFARQDPYFRQIERIIEVNNLKERITFFGFVERPILERLYRQGTIFVCPSLSEGYGIALAEAIAHGLPIIATRAGAITELVADNVNALLVNPGDSHALATAIARLAADHCLRDAIKKANIKKAATLPTWDDLHQILKTELVPAIRSSIE